MRSGDGYLDIAMGWWCSQRLEVKVSRGESVLFNVLSLACTLLPASTFPSLARGGFSFLCRLPSRARLRRCFAGCTSRGVYTRPRIRTRTRTRTRAHWLENPRAFFLLLMKTGPPETRSSQGSMRPRRPSPTRAFLPFGRGRQPSTGSRRPMHAPGEATAIGACVQVGARSADASRAETEGQSQ